MVVELKEAAAAPSVEKTSITKPPATTHFAKELNFSDFGLNQSQNCKPESGEILDFTGGRRSHADDVKKRPLLSFGSDVIHPPSSATEPIKLCGDSDHSDVEASVNREAESRGMDVDHRSPCVEISVRVVDKETMIVMAQTNKRNHPVARLMAALMELDVEVSYAILSVVKDIMMQQVTVSLPGNKRYTNDQLAAVRRAKMGDRSGR